MLQLSALQLKKTHARTETCCNFSPTTPEEEWHFEHAAAWVWFTSQSSCPFAHFILSLSDPGRSVPNTIIEMKAKRCDGSAGMNSLFNIFNFTSHNHQQVPVWFHRFLCPLGNTSFVLCVFTAAHAVKLMFSEFAVFVHLCVLC